MWIYICIYILANGMMNYGTTTIDKLPADLAPASALPVCLTVQLSFLLTWLGQTAIVLCAKHPIHPHRRPPTHTPIHHVRHKARVSNTEVSMHTFCPSFLHFTVSVCVCVCVLCVYSMFMCVCACVCFAVSRSELKMEPTKKILPLESETIFSSQHKNSIQKHLAGKCYN